MKRRTVIAVALIIILITVVSYYGYRISKKPFSSDPAAMSKSIPSMVRQIEKQQWRPLPLFRRIDPWFLSFRQKGLYPSYVQISHFFLEDYIDRPGIRRLKDRLMLKDNNMFTTAIVLEALLEMERLGVVQLCPKKVEASVNALLKHRDKNASSGLPLYCFYCQRPVDDGWKQCPNNIKMLTNYVTTLMPPVYRFLSWLDVDPFKATWKQAPDIREMIAEGENRGFLNRFNMPPDIDDTGLAMSLSCLLEQNDKYAGPAARWQKNNFDVKGLLNILKKYAYRPFSGDSCENIIDPRTYYWMRNYIRSQREKERDLILFTTWVQHVYEGEQFGNRVTKMPLNMNNVDPTVCAHLLLGLNKQILNDTDKLALLDETIQDGYLQTVDLMTWLLESNWSELNWNIILLYYPTVYHFFWSVSRNLAVLEKINQKSVVPAAFQAEALEKLGRVMRGHVSGRLLSAARQDKKNGGNYWRSDFNTVDDRVYCTALVLNTLLETWTLEKDGENIELHWLKDTPDSVKIVVHAGIRWLHQALKLKKLPLENICFSGSVKGFNTVPFLFPTNVEEQYQDLTILGIRGDMPETEYLAELAGKKRMLKSGELGERSKYFTFWTSPVLAQAVAVLALAKYCKLEPD